MAEKKKRFISESAVGDQLIKNNVIKSVERRFTTSTDNLSQPFPNTVSNSELNSKTCLYLGEK